MVFSSQSKENERGRVLVFGNQKGGSGKSTMAMHCAIGLMRLGFSVGTIDLDGEQASLSKYLKNRFEMMKKSGLELPMPEHIKLYPSKEKSVVDAGLEEGYHLTEAISELQEKNDFVIIDTAGRLGYIYELAHSFADTVITPINDSFIDLDVIADVEADSYNKGAYRVKAPSSYSAMVWKQRQNRMKRGQGPTQWVVLRNRIPKKLDQQNGHIEALLQQASKRFMFQLAPGFTERSVFRNMFVDGITLLDWQDIEGNELTLDIVQARYEVRSLLETIGLRRKVVSRRGSTLGVRSTVRQVLETVSA